MPKRSRISIRGQVWDIHFKPVPKKQWITPGEKEIGKCHFDKKLLIVDPDCGEPYYTLMHEVCHATLPDISEEAIESLEASIKAVNELCK